MSDRFFRKNIYQLGLFYQLDSFNPVYLDKTGELICKSETLLKNWNGNLNEFVFTDATNTYQGKVSMKNFWYSNQNQCDFDPENVPKFNQFISDANRIIVGVYNPKYFTRVGMRLQFILKKTPVNVRKIYTEYYREKFAELNHVGLIDTTAIGFELKNENYNIKVNINYAIKKTENNPNSPGEGILIDLDFYKALGDIVWEETVSINKGLLENINSTYQDLIMMILSKFGVEHE